VRNAMYYSLGSPTFAPLDDFRTFIAYCVTTPPAEKVL
jgi:hypothetical protein